MPTDCSFRVILLQDYPVSVSAADCMAESEGLLFVTNVALGVSARLSFSAPGEG